MRIVINQSNYIPWKGYFDLIHDADVFVFYDDVQFTKNDWRNRNRVKTADGPQWMTVPVGRLKGQNFAIESIDESSGHCRLRETDSFELSETLAAKVELEEPVHQILNLAEFDQRAISIHVYSKPYDRCLSYCRDTDTFKEVQLYYTSVDGKLCDGVSL